MVKMERIWNYVYYTIFNLYRLLYKFSNYIDPFRLFYKIPKIKKFYAKGGIEEGGGDGCLSGCCPNVDLLN